LFLSTADSSLQTLQVQKVCFYWCTSPDDLVYFTSIISEQLSKSQ
jgi:hypothetical protein